jgi:hypothetical protein
VIQLLFLLLKLRLKLWLLFDLSLLISIDDLLLDKFVEGLVRMLAQNAVGLRGVRLWQY